MTAPAVVIRNTMARVELEPACDAHGRAERRTPNYRAESSDYRAESSQPQRSCASYLLRVRRPLVVAVRPVAALRRLLYSFGLAFFRYETTSKSSPRALSSAIPSMCTSRKSSRTGLGIVRPLSYREPPLWVTPMRDQNSCWFMRSLRRISRGLLMRSNGFIAPLA